MDAPYHLDESNLIWEGGASGVSFHFNFMSANFCHVLRRHIWGYSVCLMSHKKDDRRILVNEETLAASQFR